MACLKLCSILKRRPYRRMMSMAPSEISVHISRRGPPGGVNHGHEADELSGGMPQQVANTIAKHDLVLTVNRTGRLVHRLGILQQRFDLDLFPVAPGCSP